MAKDYGFENNVFLINCGSLVVNASAVMIMLPLLLVLICCCCGKAKAYFVEKVYWFQW